MKKIFVILLAIGMLISVTSCSRGAVILDNSENIVQTEMSSLDAFIQTDPADDKDANSTENVDDSATAEPIDNDLQDPPAESNPQKIPYGPIPQPTSSPEQEAVVPTHTHEWVPVKGAVHHEAEVEQLKVVDQPAVEGHFEGGSYTVMVCRCGAEFTSYDGWLTHAHTGGADEHGGFTDSIRSNQVWIDGSPEVFHYETKVVQEAWDEEIITGYRCSCGATK